MEEAWGGPLDFDGRAFNGVYVEHTPHGVQVTYQRNGETQVIATFPGEFAVGDRFFIANVTGTVHEKAVKQFP